MAIVTDAEVMAFLGLDATGIFTITAANDVLVLTSDQGSASIDTPDGTYSGAELATALAAAMNADTTLTGSTITFAVTYSTTTTLFTIDATTGHTIAYTHTGSDAGTTYGFTEDAAAAQTITSDTAVSGEPQDTISIIHAGVEEAIKQYCHRTFDSTTYLHETHDGNDSMSIFLNQYPIISITQVAIGEMAGIKVKNTATDVTRATVTVAPDDTTMTLTVAGGTSASTDTIDLSDSSYDTLNEVVTQINTLSDGWSAKIYDSNYGSLLSSELLPVMAHSVGSRGGTEAGWSYLNIPSSVISVRFTAESAGIHYDVGFPSGFQNVIVTYTAGYATMPGDLILAVYMWVKAVYSGLEDESFGIKSWRTGDISVTYAAAISQMPDESKTILDTGYVKEDIV